MQQMLCRCATLRAAAASAAPIGVAPARVVCCGAASCGACTCVVALRPQVLDLLVGGWVVTQSHAVVALEHTARLGAGRGSAHAASLEVGQAGARTPLLHGGGGGESDEPGGGVHEVAAASRGSRS
jgi:hypothetical protein